jgi:flagellar basal body rod protein FlgB
VNLNGVLGTALQDYTLQSQVLAGDVANANTPGFQAEEVTFGQTLHGLMHPREVAAPGLMTANGNGVDLEATLSALENTSTQMQGVAALYTSRVQATQTALTDLEGA